MKTTLLILLILHGLLHGLGFAKAFGLAEINQLSQNITRPAGIAWLLAGLLFLLTAFLFFGKNQWWWAVGAVAIVVSQVLIFASWHDAKFGTVANLLVLLPVLVGFFSWKMERQTDREVQAIFSQIPAETASVVTAEQLAELPPPVRRWLENAGIVGQPAVRSAHLRQSGRLRLEPGKDWTPFTAEQYVTTDPPAFIWQAENRMMPLLDVAIRDRYVDGHGQMLAKLWSAIPIVNVASPQIDEAAMQRFLAEIVWVPSAALRPYIRWEAIDATSARATMEHRGVTGSVVFHLGENGAVSHLEALRFKDSGPAAKRLPWRVSVRKNGRLGGVLVPTEVVLSWDLPEGEFVWMEMVVEEMERN